MFPIDYVLCAIKRPGSCRDRHDQDQLLVTVSQTNASCVFGTFVVTEDFYLLALEGARTALDALLVGLETAAPAILHRARNVRSTSRTWQARPLRLLAVEKDWIERTLHLPSADGARLKALLTWAAMRQMEISMSCQGEVAWQKAAPFPAL